MREVLLFILILWERNQDLKSLINLFLIEETKGKLEFGFEVRLLATFLFCFCFCFLTGARSWTQSLLHAKLMHIHWTLSVNISTVYRWTLASKLYLLPNTTFPTSECCFLKNFTGDKSKSLLIKLETNSYLYVLLFFSFFTCYYS